MCEKEKEVYWKGTYDLCSAVSWWFPYVGVLSGTACTEDNASQWFKAERAGVQRAGKDAVQASKKCSCLVLCVCSIKKFILFKW